MKRKEEIEELLVVVDMVNGFIKEGVMSSKNIEHIIPRIKALVEKTKKSNEGVAFIKDTHTPESLEFKKFPVHCLKGTSESELVSEFNNINGIFDNDKYNSYRLNELLKTNDTTTYEVIFSLKKDSNGNWIMSDPSRETLEKLNGFYVN